MRWLITGGCGFIGRNLIRRLRSDSEVAIRIVDDLSEGTREGLLEVCDFVEGSPSRMTGAGPAYTELIVGDVRDSQLALKATVGVDVIVHLAANTGVQPSIKDPRADCLTNVVGTLNYLEGARLSRVPRFVLASSGGTVIGDCEPPIHEELVPHPKSPYGASKLAGEGYVSAYHGTFGIGTYALRFANVYGPLSSHKNSVVARFMRRALAGETLQVYGDGEQSRDFIYVDDLVDAIIACSTVDAPGGEVFQIASGRETTINELGRATGKALLRAGLPVVTVEQAPPLSGEIRRNYSDITKAERMLAWQNRTTLEEGLDKTLAWFISRQEEPAAPA
jgi:UDP-glucose 4-epimerase